MVGRSRLAPLSLTIKITKMKKITQRRITYIMGIITLIVLNSIMFYLNSNITDPKYKITTLLYLITFGSIVIIGLNIFDILKTAKTVKKENFEAFKKRIKFYESEIERYKKLIEQNEKDY